MPTTTSLSLNAWFRDLFAVSQIKKTTLRHGAPFFKYFNRTHGRGDAGYRAGEKVAIKANLNNTTDHGTIDRLNSSPHLLLSLVRQLTRAGTSAAIIDHQSSIPAGLSQAISTTRFTMNFRRRVCRPYRRRWTTKGRIQT